MTVAASPADGGRAIPSQENWVAAKRKIMLPNGIEMGYLDRGNPTGAPLLMIHGYCDTSRCWSTIAPYLTERRLLIVDLRGHGASSAPAGCYTMMEFASDLSCFITAMKLGKVDILAHSMGTMAAQTLAAAHPGQVGRLVLLAGSAMGHFRPGGWLWDNVMALNDPIDPGSDFISALYHREKPIEPPELDVFGKLEAARTPVRVWQGMLFASVMTDLFHMDALVKAPVLLVIAEKDHLIPPEASGRWQEALPHAEIFIERELGHGLHKERPAEMAAVVSGFLNR